MQKDIEVICCVPALLRFAWEVLIYLDNAREMGHSDRTTILGYYERGGSPNTFFRQMEKLFPEVKFFYYQDLSDVRHDIARANYEPVIRPYCLSRHFREHKELEGKVILYTDSDVLFLKPPLEFLAPYKDDDINYTSYTGGYMNTKYFDSKEKDVLPDKLEHYKKIDILDSMVRGIGISREVCKENDANTGGAQYLLKNMTSKFWKEVYDTCLYVRLYLTLHNKKFFENEDKGIQSWCADMWAINFLLWRDKKETRCPEEMKFAWATSRSVELGKVNIYHNAGITGDVMEYKEGDKKLYYPAFYKGANKYKSDKKTPFDDSRQLKEVVNNEGAQKFCGYCYAKKILEVKDKYKL